MKNTRKTHRQTRRRVHRGGEGEFRQLNPMAKDAVKQAAQKIHDGIEKKLGIYTNYSTFNGSPIEKWNTNFCSGKPTITREEFSINNGEIDILIADLQPTANIKRGFLKQMTNSKGQKATDRAKFTIQYLTDLKNKGSAAVNYCQDLQDIVNFLKRHYTL